MINDVKGDSAIYKFTVKSGDIFQPITGWKIECEIWDDSGNDIKKATANVVGGSDTQIKITDGVGGLFEIYIDKNETLILDDKSYIEVASFVATSKDTFYRDIINFSTPKIDWEQII